MGAKVPMYSLCDCCWLCLNARVQDKAKLVDLVGLLDVRTTAVVTAPLEFNLIWQIDKMVSHTIN